MFLKMKRPAKGNRLIKKNGSCSGAKFVALF